MRERADDSPPESLLQAVWQQQRIKRTELMTSDGSPIRVLHPGFRNFEAGPDFHDAVVKIGDQPALSGDVEIDPHPSDWSGHGHDKNPHYKNVILHVVWDGAGNPSDGKPVVALRGKLDAPLAELNLWLATESSQMLPEGLRGKCSSPLAALSRDQLLEVLREAAQGRWLAKANQFRARARQAGWEAALWEGIFRALGYKQNSWPMQNIAETMTAHRYENTPGLLSCQSRLLGIGGLLTHDFSNLAGGDGTYLRKLWDHWWRERDTYSEIILPRTLWRMNNIRPANHPQRRIALAAHWLMRADFIPQLEKWLTSTISDNDLENSLHQILCVPVDEFWSWHYTFRSARLTKPQPLIGPTRVTDLAVNVMLPWLWIRAKEGGNDKLHAITEHRFLAWGAAEDNSILKLARQRLLGGTAGSAKFLKSAAAQQGLLHIVRNFCNHSNALCEDCEFPKLLGEFVAGR